MSDNFAWSLLPVLLICLVFHNVNIKFMGWKVQNYEQNMHKFEGQDNSRTIYMSNNVMLHLQNDSSLVQGRRCNIQTAF